MVYSPFLMEDRSGERDDPGALEAKVGELEKLADSLDDVPDEELVGALDEAVELLAEINTRIEAGSTPRGRSRARSATSSVGWTSGPSTRPSRSYEGKERTTGEPGA